MRFLMLCLLAWTSVSKLDQQPVQPRERYKEVNASKSNGVVYTPLPMAHALAQAMLAVYGGSWPKRISVLDPAVGEAELLIGFVEQVRKNHPRTKISVVGYDIDPKSCQTAREKLSARFKDIDIDIRCEDFLAQLEDNDEKYDFVIANPPYVRTQVLGSKKAQEMAAKYGLSGRVDIYYSFLVNTGSVLAENGIAGYITSNKFLSIKSGNPVRKFMLENYRIHSVTDYGDTKVFENAAVLPCTVVFGNGKTDDFPSVRFTSIYESGEQAGAVACGSVFERLEDEGLFRVPDGRVFRFRQGVLNKCRPGDVWTLSSRETRDWLRTVETNTWMRLADLRRRRVGLMTSAHNVFIGNDWGDGGQSPELLKPLVTHRDAGKIVSKTNSQWRVLYPHRSVGGKRQVVEIDDFPKSKSYLEKHRAQLEGRRYVAEAGRRWYEIWVPQNPAAWAHRKIVFRDISETPQFWYDNSGSVVNGDCYWIDIDSTVPDDLVYLALAVANSAFIEKFYDLKFNTKLYSGKRRFMAQYVEQFPLPATNSVPSQKAIELVRSIVTGRRRSSPEDMSRINGLVDEMFSVR